MTIIIDYREKKLIQEMQKVLGEAYDDYVVVKWLDIPGEWHYTNEQAKKLEVLGETDNRD